jgi:hypothetical protein
MTREIYGDLADQYLKDKALLSSAINTTNNLLPPGK